MLTGQYDFGVRENNVPCYGRRGQTLVLVKAFVRGGWEVGNAFF